MSELKAGLREVVTDSYRRRCDQYMKERNTDFRISTSCGAVLPISYKPPKPSDLALRAGSALYISLYRPDIDHIHMGLIPYTG